MKVPWILAGAALAAGLGLGVVVTRNLHRNPDKKFWNERLGSSRMRRANLPVGGTLALLASGALVASGRPRVALVVAGAALGMACGAIAVGIADPLPPAG